MHPTQAVVRKHSGERPNALTGPLARLRYKHRAACAAPLHTPGRLRGSAFIGLIEVRLVRPLVDGKDPIR
jgi:hypothetical protein